VTDRGQEIIARMATLESVEMIAARDGDPAELLEQIRRVLALDARSFEEVEDAEQQLEPATARA
jgi:hypothetical protein